MKRILKKVIKNISHLLKKLLTFNCLTKQTHIFIKSCRRTLLNKNTKNNPLQTSFKFSKQGPKYLLEKPQVLTLTKVPIQTQVQTIIVNNWFCLKINQILFQMILYQMRKKQPLLISIRIKIILIYNNKFRKKKVFKKSQYNDPKIIKAA